jgi:quercetin dioxygenase-like cupin family protein
MDKVNVFKHRGDSFKVLTGTNNSQLAVMTLEPGRSTGGESGHPGDQLVLILEGSAELEVGEEKVSAVAGDAAIIPARTRHRIINSSDATLFVVSVYSPPSY